MYSNTMYLTGLQILKLIRLKTKNFVLYFGVYASHDKDQKFRLLLLVLLCTTMYIISYLIE